jgi:hypothetical protein
VFELSSSSKALLGIAAVFGVSVAFIFAFSVSLCSQHDESFGPGSRVLSHLHDGLPQLNAS